MIFNSPKEAALMKRGPGGSSRDAAVFREDASALYGMTDNTILPDAVRGYIIKQNYIYREK